MPKPLFLNRPSGLYVRFRVPSDLRDRVGSRFLIRSLRPYQGDDARLVAAVLAVSLSKVFDALRRGTGMVDVKKRLEEAQRRVQRSDPMEQGKEGLPNWMAKGVRIGNVDLGEIQVDGPADGEEFLKFARGIIAEQANAMATQPPVALLEVPVSAPSEPADESPLLSVAIEDYLGDQVRRKRVQDTITESKFTTRVFLAIVGDIPVNKLKTNHVRKFLDEVRWLPPFASVVPKYRHLSILEAIEAGKKENLPELSDHTRNKHIQKLGAFLNHLVTDDLIAKNPLKTIKAEIDTSTEGDTGRPFTPVELSAMFEPARLATWANGIPHRWWGPMIGLYTGARVNEVAQLYIEDVRLINGVWGLFFWKNTRGQKIKNKASIRFVPLARPLLDAGFLDFVEDMKATGHPRLFPHLPAGTKEDGTPNGKGYGTQLSKQFGKYVKTVGVEKGSGFHCFRHTLATALAELNILSTDIALITGHTVTGQAPVLEKHYIHIAQTATLKKRVKMLARLKPPVVLTKYVKGQFAEALADPGSFHP